jgi:hypothetical protein
MNHFIIRDTIEELRTVAIATDYTGNEQLGIVMRKAARLLARMQREALERDEGPVVIYLQDERHPSG